MQKPRASQNLGYEIAHLIERVMRASTGPEVSETRVRDYRAVIAAVESPPWFLKRARKNFYAASSSPTLLFKPGPAPAPS